MRNEKWSKIDAQPRRATVRATSATWLAVSAFLLSACGTQLPARDDGIQINAVPNLDPTLIPSNNGLLSAGINTVPGSYCFAGADGKCDPAKLSPAQCVISGATVEVTPKTNPSPSYAALVNNKYSATANVPFVNATASAEYYDEIKATVAGTAQFSSTSPNNGYPGVEGLKACILHNEGPGTYGVVYWISAANIVDVTLQHYKHVTSTAQVTATAFGLNGATYNHSGQTEEKIWIGVQASPISIGTVSGTAIKGTREAPELTPLPRGLAVRLKTPPEPLPRSAEASFLH
ncbi:hypothetical protein GO285_03991 [Ralstonia solanacearum]|nr:hypothetical protein [Ralstonia solanacearum]NKF96867.1 hypothetical protein [Ralstonia solanacearum]NKG12157.1 hypothetical protein [Ralstonia solanacearum]